MAGRRRKRACGPRFTLLAAERSAAAPRITWRLAAFMELIHVATLIHDDVVDSAGNAPRGQCDRG